MKTTELDTFTRAYIECALWSSTDDQGEPLDADYGETDIDPKTLEEMAEDCRQFQESEAELLAASGLDDSQQGHDFWLTRNRHGAGFWDRGLGDIGEKLRFACKAWGSFDLYVGDDGKIYGN